MVHFLCFFLHANCMYTHQSLSLTYVYSRKWIIQKTYNRKWIYEQNKEFYSQYICHDALLTETDEDNIQHKITEMIKGKLS